MQNLYGKYFNEWYVRDSSRKVRAVLKTKAERGERLGTRAPYGYKKDKRHVEHPKEECLVFQGTHPALVTQEI